MRSKTFHLHLRRRQLDQKLTSPTKLAEMPAFKRGFVREIREALGISSTQLARLVGVSQPAIVKLEKGERDGTVSLNTLARVAEALDCKLVYALVPKSSLDDILLARAREVAAGIIEKISLAESNAPVAENSQLIEGIASEMVRNLDKRLWDDRNEAKQK